MNLQTDIRENCPGLNEDEITRAFHKEFVKTLRTASNYGKIENAFLKDLNSAFPSIPPYQLAKIPPGLMADVILHKRNTEGDTGGDIGLTLTRPFVEYHTHSSSLKIKDYRRGLLCQAKLKNSKGKWSYFSDSQKKVLDDRLQYLGILLYKYKDTERHDLDYFQWQLCNEAASLTDMMNWLKTSIFPTVVDSEHIIKGIGNGKIGTDNEKVIDEIIAPKGNACLEIIINWPGGKPDSNVTVYSHSEERQKLYVRH